MGHHTGACFVQYVYYVLPYLKCCLCLLYYFMITLLLYYCITLSDLYELHFQL